MKNCLIKIIFYIYANLYLIYNYLYKNFYFTFIFINSFFYNTYLFKDGKIIKRIYFCNIKDFKDYEFYVTWSIQDNYIIYKISSKIHREKFTKSGYNFLLINLIVDGIKYDITSLVQDKLNCYLTTDTILFDNNFFNWVNYIYFRNKLNNNNYYFNFIDRDIKSNNVLKNEKLLLYKDGFIIK